MRKALAIAALGLLTLSLPAFAVVPVGTDDTNYGPGGGGGGGRVDCAGTVVWDTGMYDTFTPPAGCSSSFSAGCFVNALNDGGFAMHWREGANEFIGTGGDPITNIKIWARYNLQGYDYHAVTPGSLHGFCVRFYDDPTQGGSCPDGTVPDALGSPIYDMYVDSSHFIEEEIFGGVVRNFNYCLTLPAPFYAGADHYYWVSVSGDFDFTSYESGVTQWFHRMAPPGTAILCEPVWQDCSSSPCTNWDAVWHALNISCWQGWDASCVLYTNYVAPPNEACCFADGSCQDLTADACSAAGGTPEGQGTSCATFQCPPPATGACCIPGDGCVVTTRADCDAHGGSYQGDGTTCNPDPCATATKPSTWGQIKGSFR